MKRILSITTAILVIAIAGIAFLLSFAALRNVALAGGVASGLAWLWPLTLDAVMLASGLAVLWCNAQGVDARGSRVLVFLFGGLSLAFNVWLFADALSIAVHALQPVALFIGVELLSMMVHNALAVDTAKITLADTLRQRAIAQDELADVQGSVKAMEQRETAMLAAHNERLAALLPVDLIALEAWRVDPHTKQTAIAQQAGVKRQYIGQRKAHLELIGAIHENGEGVEVLV